MVGVVPAEVEISKRPQGHGYVKIEIAVDNPWFPLGLVLHGHEFHHSRLIAADPPLAAAYKVDVATALMAASMGSFIRTCLLRTRTCMPWVYRNGQLLSSP